MECSASSSFETSERSSTGRGVPLGSGSPLGSTSAPGLEIRRMTTFVYKTLMYTESSGPRKQTRHQLVGFLQLKNGKNPPNGFGIRPANPVQRIVKTRVENWRVKFA